MALIPIPLTAGSGSYTPQTVEARRRLAQQLINGQVKDQGWGGALANTLTGSRAGFEGDQASQQEAEGTGRAGRLFADALSSDNPTIQTLGAAAADPFLNQNQGSIINALLGQTMDAKDPDKILARQQAQLNYDQDLAGTGTAANAPSNIQEWEYYNKLSPEDQSRYLTMKRSNPALNVGTGFVTQDQANPGTTIGAAIPINNQQEAYDKGFGGEAGKNAAARIDALPGILNTATDMVSTIDGVLNDPALDDSTGWLSWMQQVPGTEQYRFGQRALQLQGQAFLQAFNNLKGAGQITEVEGDKATQAIGRLSTAQSPQDYRDALNELKGIIAQSKARASDRAGVAAPQGQAQPAPRIRFNPETGELE